MTNDTAAIAVFCLPVLLSVVVSISNTFTVFVFWIHRKKLSRTSFLVINLAMADLFAGVTEIIEVAGGWTLAGQIDSNKTIQGVNESVPPSFQILSSSASVFFLVLIIAWLSRIAMGVSSFIAFLGIYKLTYFAVGAAVIIGFAQYGISNKII